MKTQVLKAKMTLKGINSSSLASSLNINKSTFYNKMSGRSEFTREEIKVMIEVLELSPEEVSDIFFTV